jgi:hypothetical protein
LTIVNPLSFYSIEADITFKVNGTPADFYLDKCTLTIPSTEYEYEGECVVAEILFEKQTSTVIEYTFTNFMNIGRNIHYHISYEVGTANTWNGSITEQVRFICTGKQPMSYSGGCEVTDTTNGKNLVWSWEDERIDIDRVTVTYKINHRDPFYHVGNVVFWTFTFTLGLLTIYFRSNLTKKDSFVSRLIKNLLRVVTLFLIFLTVAFSFFYFMVYIPISESMTSNETFAIFTIGVILYFIPLISVKIIKSLKHRLNKEKNQKESINQNDSD